MICNTAATPPSTKGKKAKGETKKHVNIFLPCNLRCDAVVCAALTGAKDHEKEEAQHDRADRQFGLGLRLRG
jgi:hypothetical protein